MQRKKPNATNTKSSETHPNVYNKRPPTNSALGVNVIQSGQRNQKEEKWGLEWKKLEDLLTELQDVEARVPKSNERDTQISSLIFQLSKLLKSIDLAKAQSKDTRALQTMRTFSQFLVSWLKEHNSNVLWDNEVCDIIDALLKILNFSNPASCYTLRIVTLRALSFVFLGRGLYFLPKFPSLIAMLLPQVDWRNLPDKETQRLGTNCLGNMCHKVGIKGKRYYAQIYETLYSNYLQLSRLIFTEVTYSRLLASTLRALQILISEDKSLYHTHIASMLSNLKKLMFYGSAVPAPLPKYTKASEIEIDSSESEHSGSDIMDKLGTWKVRLHSIGCTRALAKAAGFNVFYQYWPQFIPVYTTKPSTSLATQNFSPSSLFLFQILRSDRVHQVRTAAAQLLTTMLEGAKPMMKLVVGKWEAENSEKNTKMKPFFTLYNVQGNLLKELHMVILEAVHVERNLSTKMHILKCLMTLIANTPYNQLGPGLISDILNILIPMFVHEDTNIVKTVMQCVSTTMAEHITETENFLLSFHINADKKDDNLIEYLIHIYISCNEHNFSWSKDINGSFEVKVEILNILSNLALSYFDIFMYDKDYISSILYLHSSHWEDIKPILLDVRSSDWSSIRIAATKVIDMALRGAMPSQTPLTKIPTTVQKLWLSFIRDGFTTFVSDSHTSVRLTMCNCFSRVSPEVFNLLEYKEKIAAVAMMLGLSSTDEVASVRAAACRTLGIYVLFPCLREDPMFVADSALNLVQATRDNSLTVRIRAAWSLGNLCDALILVRESDSSKDIPEDILLNIVQCALAASKDDDKVRANALRALGNFTRFASSEMLLKNEALLGSTVDTLISNLSSFPNTRSRSAKVQWNAAYAIGNIFRNTTLELHHFEWTTRGIAALLETLKTNTNFKVRINAASALGVLSNREDYRDLYYPLLLDLMEILENEQLCAGSEWVEEDVEEKNDEEEVSEKYTETLQKQLIQTLSHLLSFLSPKDDPHILELKPRIIGISQQHNTVELNRYL